MVLVACRLQEDYEALPVNIAARTRFPSNLCNVAEFEVSLQSCHHVVNVCIGGELVQRINKAGPSDVLGPNVLAFDHVGRERPCSRVRATVCSRPELPEQG
jgi:hypothetical protein